MKSLRRLNCACAPLARGQTRSPKISCQPRFWVTDLRAKFANGYSTRRSFSPSETSLPMDRQKSAEKPRILEEKAAVRIHSKYRNSSPRDNPAGRAPNRQAFEMLALSGRVSGISAFVPVHRGVFGGGGSPQPLVSRLGSLVSREICREIAQNPCAGACRCCNNLKRPTHLRLFS